MNFWTQDKIMVATFAVLTSPASFVLFDVVVFLVSVYLPFSSQSWFSIWINNTEQNFLTNTIPKKYSLKTKVFESANKTNIYFDEIYRNCLQNDELIKKWTNLHVKFSKLIGPF